MKAEMFYAAVNGDWQDVMGRLMKEERVVKFLRRFAAGTEMKDLEDALAAENWEGAFRASHTLKGVAANLGLSQLYRMSSELCEELRPCVKPTKDISGMAEEIRKNYADTVAMIAEIDG